MLASYDLDLFNKYLLSKSMEKNEKMKKNIPMNEKY